MSTRGSLVLASLLSCLLIAGCGSRPPSLSEYQCAAGDWFTVGELDGRNGYAQARLLVHQDACGPQGIVPDSADYRRGWATGIAQFCDPSRAYQQGLSGRRMPTVCPQHLQQAYEPAYNQGRELYLARAKVSRLESAVADAEQRVDRITSQVLNLATAQLAPGLSPQERVRLATSAQELLTEQQRLQRRLPDMHQQLSRARQHLAVVESSNATLATLDPT